MGQALLVDQRGDVGRGEGVEGVTAQQHTGAGGRGAGRKAVQIADVVGPFELDLRHRLAHLRGGLRPVRSSENAG